ncbi:MAG: hypothetical protein WCQ20_08080, partial [Synechococcaceae cyanobacterium ELA739]
SIAETSCAAVDLTFSGVPKEKVFVFAWSSLAFEWPYVGPMKPLTFRQRLALALRWPHRWWVLVSRPRQRLGQTRVIALGQRWGP